MDQKLAQQIQNYEKIFVRFDFTPIFDKFDVRKEVYMCLASFFATLSDIRTIEVKNPDQAIVAGDMVIGSPDAVGPNDYFVALCKKNLSIEKILGRCKRDTGYVDFEAKRNAEHILSQLATGLKASLNR
ncbi:hypothetical protein [Paraburkholderia tropica]|uniref:hypothetical protein n=1 Tax=Paraburkholderia tropica TaxID=92647 RepID=UPI003D2C6422